MFMTFLFWVIGVQVVFTVLVIGGDKIVRTALESRNQKK